MLTEGDYRRTAGLAQAAQRIAPHGRSAYIQATAQEGRAWARLGAAPETRAALRGYRRAKRPARPSSCGRRGAARWAPQGLVRRVGPPIGG